MKPMFRLLLLACLPALAPANDGRLDPDYGNDGRTAIGFDASDRVITRAAVRFAPTGSLWLLGDDVADPYAMAIARLLPGGLPDPQFGANGDGRRITELPPLVPQFTGWRMQGSVLQADGKPLVFGGLRSRQGSVGVFPAVVCRLTAAGTLDDAYGVGGCRPLRSLASAAETCTVNDVSVLPDQRAVAVGSCQADDLAERPFIARLTPTGAVDLEFGAGVGLILPPAPVTDVSRFAFRAVSTRVDGEAVVLGELTVDTGVGQSLQPGLWQFDAGGSLDPAFSGDGFAYLSFQDLGLNPARATDLALTAEGDALALAQAESPQGKRVALIARYGANGEPAAGFGDEGRRVDDLAGIAGAASRLNALTLDPQQRLLVAGTQSDALPDARARAGTDFWFQFIAVVPPAAAPKLWITAQTAASGHVRSLSGNFELPFQVQPGQITEVTLPVTFNAPADLNDQTTDLGLHLTASAPVVVQAFGGRGYSSDSTSLLPTSELGTEYRVHAWRHGLGRGSSFTIVASAPGSTSVTIRPSVTVAGRPAGQPYQIALQQGQMHQLWISGADLSGSRVSSDKPVAVFAGHTCAQVPNTDVSFCEQVAEQMEPLERWGHDFVAAPLPGRSSGDVISVLAHESGTAVSIDGQSAALLSAGEVRAFPLSSPLRLRATHPVSVMQFAKGCGADQLEGQVCVADPTMVTVRSRSGWSTRQIALIPPYAVDPEALEGTARRYLAVVAEQAAVDSLRMNGQLLGAASFSPIGDGQHVRASLQLSAGVYTLEADAAFAAVVHGIGQSQAFAYPAAHAPLPAQTPPPGMAPPADDLLLRYRDNGLRDPDFGIAGIALFDHAIAHPATLPSGDGAAQIAIDGGTLLIGSASTDSVSGRARMVAYRVDAATIFRDGFEEQD